MLQCSNSATNATEAILQRIAAERDDIHVFIGGVNVDGEFDKNEREVR